MANITSFSQHVRGYFIKHRYKYDLAGCIESHTNKSSLESYWNNINRKVTVNNPQVLSKGTHGGEFISYKTDLDIVAISEDIIKIIAQNWDNTLFDLGINPKISFLIFLTL